MAPSTNAKGAWETIEVAHAPFIGLRKTTLNHPSSWPGRPLSCDLPPPKFEDDFEHVVFLR
jgi:hypothetical protein